MQAKDAQLLLKKYHAGLCTDDEKILVNKWFHEIEINEQANLSEMQLETVHLEMWANVQKRKHPLTVKSKLWTRIAAAASILLFISTGSYFLLKNQPLPENVRQQSHDIAPGSNKAVLTLSNGRQILLTDAKNGKLAVQANTVINKTDDGQITYDKTSETSESVYNTMTTPRGGQYHLILADGTAVWLNAASSIKYPTVFTANERLVEITGEAYFQVAHNPSKPFIVKSNGQRVTVLGTHFNVNAYSEEAVVRTTLLEGSVNITSGSLSKVIRPGEQSVLGKDRLDIISVDTEDAVAWKNGMFRFTDESLEVVMRKVARWYDVDVFFLDSESKKLPCNGITTRFDNVSKVLRMIELTKQVHFKIEGKKITISKA